MTLRVLLVDDQPLIRVGFTAILRSQPDLEVVGEAGDGEDALRLAAETDPDVICMDVQMPRLDGVEATRRLVAGGTRAAVLILTTFDTDEALFAALTAGAAGFLLKSAGPEELIEAVRVLGRGDALLDPQVTRRVLQRMTAGPGRRRPRRTRLLRARHPRTRHPRTRHARTPSPPGLRAASGPEPGLGTASG
ncbi:response regulator transcription factor [Micrococcus sp. M4NT]|nr:response regulator transcription factor [Micrococcus sp. M4NT]